MSSHRRVLLFTGDGKGKTTAAMGMAVRAVGHGLRVCIIQFIKNDPQTGERIAFSTLPHVEFIQTGLGVVPAEDHEEFSAHREAAKAGLEMAAARLEHNTCDLIVLDEICTACAMNLITPQKVLSLIENTPSEVIWVLTGRGAPDPLIKAADTVTVMECLKHGLQAGIMAGKGVEY